MCHANAVLYDVAERGFIREGYFADLTIVNMEAPYTVSPNNILYKCGWSPLTGMTLPATIETTFVNGHPVLLEGEWNELNAGHRLLFNR